MARATLTQRVEVLEDTVSDLATLPARMTAVERELVEFRVEVRQEFVAVRTEIRGVNESLLGEIRTVEGSLRTEIR